MSKELEDFSDTDLFTKCLVLLIFTSKIIKKIENQNKPTSTLKPT